MEDVTEEKRLMLTKACMRVLDSWKISPDGMGVALTLNEKDATARGFQKFRQHKAFPKSEDTYRCVDYILRIESAMRTTYPVNGAMSERWLRQKNRRIGMAPLQKIMQEGEAGLIATLAELDCTFCFDLTNPPKTESVG